MLNAEIVKKEEDKNTETVSVRIFKLSCNIYADADNIAVWRTNWWKSWNLLDCAYI
jgi:hypothetical protein